MMLLEPNDLTQLLDSCSDDQPLPVTAALKPSDHTLGPFLERSEVVMPPNYLPRAPGVQLAGPRMLKLAGCVRRKRCPYGWEKIVPGVYMRYPRWHEEVEPWDTSRVRQSGDWRTRRWAVERVDYSTGKFQALVFAFDSIPIWAQSRREAMFLAEFYREDHALQLVGCCWKNPFAVAV
jgi:hypothetical protein